MNDSEQDVDKDCCKREWAWFKGACKDKWTKFQPFFKKWVRALLISIFIIILVFLSIYYRIEKGYHFELSIHIFIKIFIFLFLIYANTIGLEGFLRYCRLGKIQEVYEAKNNKLRKILSDHGILFAIILSIIIFIINCMVLDVTALFFQKEDAGKSLFNVYAGTLGLIAFCATAFVAYVRFAGYLQAQKQFDFSQKQFYETQIQKLNEEIEKRFQEGIKLLGNDNESVRLGGIYILWEIIKDAAKAIPYLEAKHDAHIRNFKNFDKINENNEAEINGYKKAYTLHKQILDILCAHVRTTTNSKEYLFEYYPSIAKERFPRQFKEVFEESEDNNLKKIDEKPSNEIQTLLNLLLKTPIEIQLIDHNMRDDAERDSICTRILGFELNFDYSIFKGADFSKAHFERFSCLYVDFRNTNCMQAHFEGANCQHAYFNNANCCQAYFNDANCMYAYFKGVDSNFVFASFKNANCMLANFEGTSCERSDFSGANCVKAYFDNARCIEAHFEGTHCELATFKGAICKEVSFVGANCENACFDSADCEKANFDGATFSETSFIGLDNDKLKEASFCGINATLGGRGDIEHWIPVIIFGHKENSERIEPLSTRTAHEWADKFKCPSLKMDQPWRISITEVKRFLDLGLFDKREWDSKEIQESNRNIKKQLEEFLVLYEKNEKNPKLFFDSLNVEKKEKVKKYLNDFDDYS